MNPLNPYHWLALAAIVGALIFGVHRLDQSRQKIGYDKAKAEYALQAKKADVKREAVSPPIAAKQEAAQVQIRTVTKTIIKEVPVYVKATDFPMPAGFRVLHDAAADGTLPDPARIPDAAPVPAQDVAGTITENYGTCHETATRLVGLQSWVAAQQALNQ